MGGCNALPVQAVNRGRSTDIMPTLGANIGLNHSKVLKLSAGSAANVINTERL